MLSEYQWTVHLITNKFMIKMYQFSPVPATASCQARWMWDQMGECSPRTICGSRLITINRYSPCLPSGSPYLSHTSVFRTCSQAQNFKIQLQLFACESSVANLSHGQFWCMTIYGAINGVNSQNHIKPGAPFCSFSKPDRVSYFRYPS